MSIERQRFSDNAGTEIEQEQLKGFARSIAEIEWLLLILVMMFMLVSGARVQNPLPVIIAMALFVAFIITFHYVNFSRRQTHIKLAVETWVMVAFITAVLWETGREQSPLLNLYLLPIIASALTMGKWITILQVALISACYMLLSFASLGSGIFTLDYAGQIMGELAPFLLVAFLTTMLLSDIHIAKSRIQALSETDELTGLPNMRAFSKALHMEHEKSQRYERSYSILLTDLDNLKFVNDSFGHDVGNRAIVLVANVLDRVTRSTDLAARYGGDEFIMLLPETDANAAQEVVKRIRNSVHGATLDMDKKILRSSVSIGVATYPVDNEDPQKLIVAADQRMYRDKELRRPPQSESAA